MQSVTAKANVAYSSLRSNVWTLHQKEHNVIRNAEHHMHAGSWNSKLSQLNVGECLWVEVDEPSDAPNLMRLLNPAISRRPEEIRGGVFETSAWNACGMRLGQTKMLVRVERKL